MLEWVMKIPALRVWTSLPEHASNSELALAGALRASPNVVSVRAPVLRSFIFFPEL